MKPTQSNVSKRDRRTVSMYHSAKLALQQGPSPLYSSVQSKFEVSVRTIRTSCVSFSYAYAWQVYSCVQAAELGDFPRGTGEHPCDFRKAFVPGLLGKTTKRYWNAGPHVRNDGTIRVYQLNHGDFGLAVPMMKVATLLSRLSSLAGDATPGGAR